MFSDSADVARSALDQYSSNTISILKYTLYGIAIGIFALLILGLLVFAALLVRKQLRKRKNKYDVENIDDLFTE